MLQFIFNKSVNVCQNVAVNGVSEYGVSSRLRADALWEAEHMCAAYDTCALCMKQVWIGRRLEYIWRLSAVRIKLLD